MSFQSLRRGTALWRRRSQLVVVVDGRLSSPPSCHWMTTLIVRPLAKSPVTSDLVQYLLQTDPSNEEAHSCFRGWDDGSPGAIPESQKAYIKSDEVTGEDVALALVHAKDHDPHGDHSRPYLLDLIFTVPSARQRGHSLALLQHLVTKEELQLTAFVTMSPVAELLHERAGFIQLKDDPSGSMQKYGALFPGFSIEDLPTIWRGGPPEKRQETTMMHPRLVQSPIQRAKEAPDSPVEFSELEDSSNKP